MTRRMIRTVLALVFVFAGVAVHANHPFECYDGQTYRTPEGYYECFPGAGNNCLYCE